MALAVLGPGVTVFGDGPDGGREATFDGPVAFPNPAAPWDGYGVIQAKFRQRPLGGGKDADWVIDALKAELDKFIDPERKLRRPEYYLFATNVVLTPAVGTGGKDRVATLFEDYQDRLALKEWHVWDHDQLGALLDTQDAIRTAYAAWITAGDVLAHLLAKLQPRTQDFRTIMVNFLQKELLAEQYVNLGQAGHSPEGPIPLARVFIDLPVGERDTGPLDYGARPRTPEARDQATGIAELLEMGGQRLDPGEIQQENRRPRSLEETIRDPFGVHSLHVLGHVVLIGGPGQGKSTLTQFLCQLHRVALLEDIAKARLLPEADDACRLIRGQCGSASLTLPAMPRFPARVELSRFAAALGAGEVASLFDWLLALVRRHTARDLCADDLRDWLATWPWLLVLDGLDEVPASANRQEVIHAVTAFRVDANDCKADLLLVATTRPQGYNYDFSPRYFRHQVLLPLAVQRALQYAKRLAEQRWGADQDKVARINERMAQAGREPTTAHLMQSPLQVTIMTLLVETVGQPPRERSRLFDEYYRIIMRRERERAIPAADLLNAHEADIDVIHQRVGLQLQRWGAGTGGTEALLTHEQFTTLVSARLEEQGYDAIERARLTAAIITATLERLVFLVSPRDGRIGFEIRSLQEFMAAACLLNGSDEQVRSRLREIAPLPYWRNVFLFATGRCFHDRQHLRDSIHALCCELNDNSDLNRALLTGSQLALEILEDGAVARQPAQLRLFARLALRLTDLPPDDLQSRLARQYRPEVKAVFREELSRALADSNPARRFGAWRTLLPLVDGDVLWARQLAEASWPFLPEEADEIVQASATNGHGRWAVEQWSKVVFQLPPAGVLQRVKINRIARRLKPLETDPLEAACRSSPLAEFAVLQEGARIEIELQQSPDAPNLSVVSAFTTRAVNVPTPPASALAEWQWIGLVAAFLRDPSTMTLAEIIRSLPKQDFSARIGAKSFWLTPWPVSACVEAILRGYDRARLAQLAAAGELGDLEDWQSAETRWATEGLKFADLDYSAQHGLPFDKAIAKIGFPFEVAMVIFRVPGHSYQLRALAEYRRSLSQKASRALLAMHLFSLLATFTPTQDALGALEEGELKDIIAGGRNGEIGLDTAWEISNELVDGDDVVDIFDMLGNIRQINAGNRDRTAQAGEFLEQATIAHPDRGGLLRLLAKACADGYAPKDPQLIPNSERFDDDRFRVAAWLVLLAQGRLPTNRAGAMASTLIDCTAAEPTAVDDALAVLANNDLPDATAEALLLALWEALPSDRWQTRAAVIAAMQERKRLGASADLTLA